MMKKRIYQKTLEEFIGKLPIVEEKHFSRRHKEILKATEDALIIIYHKYTWGKLQFHEIDASNPSLKAVKNSNRMLLLDRNSDHLIGGIVQGTTYIFTEHRGKGLSKFLHLAADNDEKDRFLSPTSYSRMGYEARRSAHREAVRLAILTGDEVPLENLVRYAQEIPEAIDAMESHPSGRVTLLK